MKIEVWKDIKGYEGIYQVSDLGRIKSLARPMAKRSDSFSYSKEKIKKTALVRGYYNVCLYKNSVMKNFKVHRLIAIAFIPNPENKPQINHINGIKTDNSISNLEWNTARENLVHAIETGLKKHKYGEDNGKSKLTEEQVLEIRSLSGLTRQVIADKYGICTKTVTQVVNRLSWKTV